MKPEEQRIAIAEACGIKRYQRPYDGRVFLCAERPTEAWHAVTLPVDKINSDVPDYLTDLNAMHEAEKALPKDMKTDYVRHLNKGDFANYRLAFATAAQRAEAFLKTLNLWTTHPTKGPK